MFNELVTCVIIARCKFFNSACSSSGVKAGGKLLFVVTMPTNTNIFLNICAMNSNIASVPFRIFRVYRQHCLRAFAISTSITSSPIFEFCRTG